MLLELRRARNVVPKILWRRGRHLCVDMQQLPRLFWQFVYWVFYIFGLFLQRWIYRSQWGPVHRMRRWKIQNCLRNGGMHRVSLVFKFGRQQHSTCCLCLQRWLYQPRRRHMHRM